jgi:RHS repeat-associated protein
VGTSTAAYDSMGRLTGITHAPSASPSIAYGYAYDAASRITALTTPEGTSSFTLDATDQLTSASLTGEAYAYDKTGNRTSGNAVTGTGNRLLTDGTYRYAYDAEGNRTAKFVDTNAGGTLSVGDTDVTIYAYDQRNRLVAVSHVNAWTSTQAAGLASFTVAGTPLPSSDLELRYTYDYADRRIRKSLDADGQAGAGQEAVSFAAYAGDVRTLEIARPADRLVINTATGQVIGFLGQVVQRTFYGNGVDEILAVDRVTWNGTTPTTSTFWTFADHQDSVRDIVSGNAADRGQVVEHRQYDSFGKVVRRTTGPQAGAATTAGVGVEFAYAGRPFEARTGLSDNRARWYEPGTGRFVNEDPSGFKGGDANLFRYVGNDPLNQVDPSGLAAKWASGAKASVPTAGWAALGQQPLESPAWAGTKAFFGSLGNSLTNAATGLKDLVTGEVGRQLGERAFQITVNNNGGKFNGQWGQVGYNIVGQMAGTHAMAEGMVGIDLATRATLDGTERATRIAGGVATFTGIAAGGAGMARTAAGAGSFTNLPGSATVSRLSSGAVRSAASVGARPAGSAQLPIVNPSFTPVSVPRSAPAAGIGRTNWTVSQFADEVFVRYQQFYDQAYGRVQARVARGLMPNDLTKIGQVVDSRARSAMRRWLAREDIAEGPGQVIQINRWLRDPAGSGAYRIPDVRIPSANIVFDGTIGWKSTTTPQIIDFRGFSGGNNVMIVRPTQLGGSHGLVFP